MTPSDLYQLISIYVSLGGQFLFYVERATRLTLYAILFIGLLNTIVQLMKTRKVGDSSTKVSEKYHGGVLGILLLALVLMWIGVTGGTFALLLTYIAARGWRPLKWIPVLRVVATNADKLRNLYQCHRPLLRQMIATSNERPPRRVSLFRTILLNKRTLDKQLQRFGYRFLANDTSVFGLPFMLTRLRLVLSNRVLRPRQARLAIEEEYRLWALVKNIVSVLFIIQILAQITIVFTDPEIWQLARDRFSTLGVMIIGLYLVTIVKTLGLLLAFSIAVSLLAKGPIAIAIKVPAAFPELPLGPHAGAWLETSQSVRLVASALRLTASSLRRQGVKRISIGLAKPLGFGIGYTIWIYTGLVLSFGWICQTQTYRYISSSNVEGTAQFRTCPGHLMGPLVLVIVLGPLVVLGILVRLRKQ